MNEAETRAEHVDPALKAAGWGVVEGSRILREYPITLGRLEGHGRRGKPLIADYVLVYRDHKLAVVEAKAWDKPLTEGLAQAKNYAEKLAVRAAYATNGQGIYGVDRQTGAEGEIERYSTPGQLWDRAFPAPSVWRDRFAAVPFEDKGGYFRPRYYQDIAINRVLEAIAANRERLLLTLATGTGKTFIAFQIAWKLFQSRWSRSGEPTRRPRILFLADRNILANQAYNAFSAFPEDALVRIDPGDIRRTGRVPKNGSLFFTIFQTFLSGPPQNGQPSPYFGEYSADFFDCIIIDECHRGGANDESNWRGILDYFSPAVQIGLTATPKRRDNVDTYAYFGDPVSVYSLREGINDGFLTPFKVKQFATTLDEYVYTPDDQLIEGEIERGRRFVERDFNRSIEITQREQHRVNLFLQQMHPDEKTLVFCATQEHARLVRDLINQTKQSTDPNYCHRVTADDGALGEQFLRDFQDNEKTVPTILTTSQKLATGVDARNIRNIVLMRPINSLIEFKQIIGRGTRLCEGKDYFTILDFVKAHQHFSDPEWDGEPLDPEPGDGPKPPKEPEVVRDPPQEYDARPTVKIKLADGKERTIRHLMVTTYWHPDSSAPVSADQFIEVLLGKLPELFRNENELRALWSDPQTRRKLLERLAEKGFGGPQLAEMQRIIDAENSDVFDVLAHVAYASPPRTRQERAALAITRLPRAPFNNKQCAFLQFVLAQYIREGVRELDVEKLTPLLNLRYHNSLADAVADLGRPEEINKLFSGFQKYLYQHQTAA